MISYLFVCGIIISVFVSQAFAVEDTSCSNRAGDENCTAWARAGACSRRQDLNDYYCVKACTGCGSISCNNRAGDVNCKAWASGGACSRRQDMKDYYCVKACTGCGYEEEHEEEKEEKDEDPDIEQDEVHEKDEEYEYENDKNRKDLKLVVVTLATAKTDGHSRFMRSAKIFGYQVEVVPTSEMFDGEQKPSKIEELQKALQKYAADNEMVIMFTDSPNVILVAEAYEAINKFVRMKANVVFSIENKEGYKYLCTGGIIGYASSFYKLLTLALRQDEDAHSFFTKTYLNDREKYNLALDHRAEIFENLGKNRDEVALAVNPDGIGMRISNQRFHTLPISVRGSGPSADHLSNLGNYLAKTWTFGDGCIGCAEDSFSLNNLKDEDWPQILIGLFIEAPTPFVSAYLEHISNLDYPKKKIDIFLHNADPHHNPVVEEWAEKHNKHYKSLTMKDPELFMGEVEARNIGMSLCGKISCDYYLSVDASITLNNRDALKILVEQNRTFLTPIMSKPGKLWSNFWGAVLEDGFYARSPDYIDIVKNMRRGIWNSPYVSGLYLIRASTIKRIPANPFGTDTSMNIDVNFCALMRSQGIFMYATNLQHFGHLKEVDTYTTNFKHNDMYQLFDNKLDWEDQYLHPDFTRYLNPDSTQIQPCPDVYWFPFATKNFTRHLIEECERYGKWTGGKQEDSKNSGGMGNLPTVDIHMYQIGFERHWLQMLRVYIAPLATRNYRSYHSHEHCLRVNMEEKFCYWHKKEDGAMELSSRRTKGRPRQKMDEKTFSLVACDHELREVSKSGLTLRSTA